MKKDYLVAAIAIVVVGGIIILSRGFSGGKETNVQSPQVSSSEMSDHHAPPPPADESVFKSLLDKPAPDFTLESYEGSAISLKDFKGKNIILFFTEGAMCYPSCWDQIVALKKEATFNNEATVTLSIVVDSRQEWADAASKMPELAKATVLLDTKREVSKLYGVLTVASSMHRGQYPGHTYLIVDKEGVIRYQMDDERMGIRNKELLAALSSLN